MIPRVFALLRSIATAALLSGCEPEPSAAEQAAADARDIAMVEAAQERHPPIQPVTPQAIAYSDLERLKLPGASCRFEPAGGRDPIMLAFERQAVMLFEGEPTTFASDTGGPPGPVGTWLHYVGKALSLRIEKGDGDGVRAGNDALEWAAKLAVRDEFDRVIYTRSGRLRCGA
jgi:hypothetical protein